MSNIAVDPEGRTIEPNWTVDGGPGAFAIVAPYRDGLPGQAMLGTFVYRPHARLAARAPAMAQAMNEFCDRVERGEVRSKRTYATFCEILERKPRQ